MIKRIKINQLHVSILIDTGAELSLIAERTYKKLIPTKESAVYINMTGLGGANITSKVSIQTKLKIDNKQYEHPMLVVPDMSINYDAILGFDFLQNTNFTWDKGYIFHDVNAKSQSLPHIFNISLHENSNLGSELIEKMIKEYHPKTDVDSPISMKIIPIKDEPFHCSPSKLPLAYRDAVKSQIKEWL